MKFTLSWLKDHLETDATLDEICTRLTEIGLEVEDVDDKAAFKPFVIAKVISAEKHPQADRLKVLMVDTGQGAPVQVVCGAPNARAGLVGAFAAPAAYAHLDDPVIEINLTPNRPDCTSIYGIARDLAASGLGTLKTRPAPSFAV